MCNGDSIAGLIKSIITTNKYHFIMGGALTFGERNFISHTEDSRMEFTGAK